MADTVVMPRLGMTMLEATVVKWLREDGSDVQAGDVILEVETDKIVQEIEATSAGRLKQAAAVGESIQIGRPLAHILAEGEELPETSQRAGSAATPKARQPRAGRATAGGRRPPMRATPIARRIAAEHNLDLDSIQGSGPSGRIVEADVRAAIESGAAPGSRKVSERVPLSGVRAATARHMQESAAIPQVTLNRECDAAPLLRARENLALRESELGVRVSYNAMFVKALAAALAEFPALNSSMSDGAVDIFEDINVGVAVNTDRGLLVPVLNNADKRPLVELTKELQTLSAKAADATLEAKDLSGGTATITNLGAFGVDYFNPILNSPECVILGIGRIRPGDGGAATVWLSLTFDHRVADGADAARLLDHIAGSLSDPARLV